MHGGTHSCKIYKPLPQQGLINRLSGIKSSNPFDTDSICDYASQAMLKEHGQPIEYNDVCKSEKEIDKPLGAPVK